MSEDRPQNAAHSTDEVRWRVNNRIIGFSDGVFAIAITLLVLTIDVPANLTSQEVSSFLREALPQVLIYGASFMVIGTFWLRHYRMFSLCRAVDAQMLVLNLVFLAFVSLLPFPTDLIDYADQSPSAVIAFCMVGGAATLCEFALWRHLHRHPDLLLPDISEETVVALRTLRFLSLGLFIVSILVSLLSARIAIVLLLAFLPLYEVASYRRGRHRPYRVLYLLRDP
jgi:uncharacterized membrane protein